MALQQRLEQTQKLILSQSMQQSLRCLQMPILELRSFLQETALANPLLDVSDTPLERLPLEPAKNDNVEDCLIPIERREQIIWDAGRGNARKTDAALLSSHSESFTDYLNKQLGQLPGLNAEMLYLCQYLVGCLNSAGYLDVPVAELAQELNISTFNMEQALYIVQALDPPGTGARNLSECLLLQLVQSNSFTELNIHLVRRGLPLLAEEDYEGLSDLLGVGTEQIHRAADVVRSLNPIPSSGFNTGGDISYAVPEAFVNYQDGKIIIEINEKFLPKLSLNPEYCALLKDPRYPEAHTYLKEKMVEVKGILTEVQGRSDTLYHVISLIVQKQKDALFFHRELQPMTMKKIAEELALNTSTVSRAVKDKCIQVNNRPVFLRRLFTNSLPTPQGREVSSDAARQQLRCLIASEDKSAPLSDRALCEAMSDIGIVMSRRTVAKYRNELKIPAVAGRRQRRK